jgi:hypothetical protein
VGKTYRTLLSTTKREHAIKVGIIREDRNYRKSSHQVKLVAAFSNNECNR